ncbi:unnamed protein product [Adineta ricciae]|uniref:Nucleotidyl transferase domain-containing protein n=1 Tax=Adineta ricciae TaxID=249248 RepID=A0A814NSF9_ADIRI|nr:unnamed protein product [Adineta ricciae]CAF1421121.1 unnamed protein product [Adineta ricciae]
MNIIIPMGGIGNRFSKENYRFPKPLINIVGRPMLFWLFDHLETEDDDIIYLGLLENLDKQFNLSQRLKIEYPEKKFEKILLDFETRGAVETLFIVLQSMNPDRLKYKTISLDCDTIYFESILKKFRAVSNETNVSFYFEDHQGKPIYSYLNIDENLKIIDVREKIMISNHANTGAYGFRSGQILKDYAIQLLDEAVGYSGEYYTTNLMKLMLQNNEDFRGIEIQKENFICVGTPDQLNEFLKLIKTKRSDQFQIRQMRFCFDLDNTLVSYPTIYGDYNSVEPIYENIQLVKELYEAGHHIIIQTARRMKTHQGNLGAVIADIGHVTLNTLQKFQIPYHELFFGKPYADIYIDDSAIHALIDTRKEIGWLIKQFDEQNLNENKKRVKGFISSRDFHTIEQLDNLIIKSSTCSHLQGEIYFYQNLPKDIEDLFPKFYRIETNEQAGITSLVIEKISGITYSHLFTNLCLTQGRFLKLLNSLKRIHFSIKTHLKSNIYANYFDKILLRYQQYNEIYLNLDQHFQNKILNSKEFLQIFTNFFSDYQQFQYGKGNSIIHGDPVFSNILLKSNNNLIFLDMRGCLGKELSLEGDLNYDLAKVYQSLSGYDFILLDKQDLLKNQSIQLYIEDLKKVFLNFLLKEYSNENFNFKHIQIITSHLFFTLIPLHNNFQHQIQFYQLAFQLYQQYLQ